MEGGKGRGKKEKEESSLSLSFFTNIDPRSKRVTIEI